MFQWLRSDGACEQVFFLRGMGRVGLLSSGLFRCVLLLVLAFPCGGTAVAASLPPAWSVPAQLTSDDGHAFISWTLPASETADIFKITETFKGESSVHYTESNSLRAWRVQPGVYDFVLQACSKHKDAGPVCGSASSPLALKVTEAVTSKLLTGNVDNATPITSSQSVDGGPDQLRPGHWYSAEKDGHGWSFYWSNRLALQKDDPLFGNSYDLVGVWYTYEGKSAVFNPTCYLCPIEVGDYRPVALKLNAVATGQGTFAGGLYLSQANGSELWVGSAEMTFGPDNSTAIISWSANFKKESLSDTDSLALLLGNDRSDANNISNFSGLWERSGDNRYFVVTNIGDIAEVATVVFNDDAGDPTWIQAVNAGSAIAGSTSYCFAYQYEGYSPQINKPSGWSAGWYLSGCNSALPADSNNRNSLRYFNGLNQAFFWADFTLPGTGFASGSISIGSSSSSVSLEKSASFHGINYVSPTGDGCQLNSAPDACQVELTWYTDGDYPDATVYAHNVSTNTYYKVLTSGQSAMVNVPYQPPTVGQYRFQLRMGNGTATSLIASSAQFTVSEGVPNSPPVLGVLSDQNSLVGSVVGLLLSAVDPDEGDDLTFSESGLPAGLSLDAVSGWISGTVSALIGEYEVSVVVQDNHGNIDSKSFNWTVSPANSNPEQPPEPALAPAMSASSSSSSVGATAADFSVSESGGATYSMPILTAPGSGGVVPQVSLNYSSHAGNGDVGVGWSLGGVSAITLCPQTTEQDGIAGSKGIGLTGEDRFCLDGQRLVADAASGAYGGNGTQYRTEIDNFARITSYGTVGNGPAWFRVERKDGAVVEYGNSADSGIEARGSKAPETRFVWAQNRFEDQHGNYILYNYLENASGPVGYALQSIDYTGNIRAGTLPTARLSFFYGDRDAEADLTYSYFAGVKVEQRYLLRSIRSQARVLAGSPLVDLRFYELNYEQDGVGRTILTALTECRSSSRAICYPSTRFDWLKSESTIDTEPTLLADLLPKATLSGLLLADVSGDGRTDLLYTNSKSKRHTLHIREATANAGFLEWEASYTLPQRPGGRPPRVFAVDINSDGLQDVVYSKYAKTTDDYTWVALISNGSGLSAEVALNPAHRFFLNANDLDSRFQIMDFNGDGLSDIVHAHTNDIGKAWQLSALLNTTAPGGKPGLSAPIDLDVDNAGLFPPKMADGWEMSGFPPFYNWAVTENDKTDVPDAQIFDFNGDGAVDLLLKVWRYYQKCLSNCTVLASSAGSAAGVGNGSGDPVYQVELASFWVLMESNGQDAFTRHSIVAMGEDCSFVAICRKPEYEDLPRSDDVWPVDINADGLADLAWGSADGNWRFRLNTGDEFAAVSLIGKIPAKVNKQVRFEDWNGDDYPDLVYPSDILNDNATWMLHQNHFGRVFAASSNTGVRAGNVGGEPGLDDVENDTNLLADFSGDGKPDQLSIDRNKRGEILSTSLRMGMNVSGARAIEPSNVIRSITNGFGAVTGITYLPLTDSRAYTRMYDSAAASWGKGAPVYDYIAPLYVVSDVSVSSPTYANPSARSRAEYHYVGAKLQAGGRGLLGFAEIIVYDPQLRTRTNTRYRQDFPFTGLPVDTLQTVYAGGSKFSAVTDVSSRQTTIWPTVSSSTRPSAVSMGTVLSYSIKNWRQAKTITGATRIYSDASLQRNYTLAGNPESRVFTQSNFDGFGNMINTVVSTFDDDGNIPFSMRETDNTWSAVSLSNWTMGRLGKSTVTHTRTGKVPVIRNSAFEYSSTTGAMTREIIEPGDNSVGIVTAFSYDLFGNRSSTSRQGAGMAARTSSVAYDPLGRFVIRETNALGQVFRKVSSGKWDVFGNPLQIENIDGVRSTSAIDLMGRPFASHNETGAWQKSLNYVGGGRHCPVGTAWYSVSTNGGGAVSQQCFDVIGRDVRKGNKSLTGQLVFVDRYYDASGRANRVSEPYFEGETMLWSETAYDKLGRVTGVLSAGGDDVTIRYDEQAASACSASNPRVIVTLNALGQQATEVKNVLGETVESFDNQCGQVSFSHDSMGYMTKVTGAEGLAVSMSYDSAGRKIAQTDPDMGTSQYAYNALGELTRQLDSKQQAVDFEYDALGRVSHRRELTGVDSLSDVFFTTVNHENTLYRAASPGKSQPSVVTYREGESGVIIHQRETSFESLGRVSGTSTTIDGRQFYERTTYDAYGRVFQQFDPSGNDHGLRYAYKHGHLSQLKEAREGVNGVVYQNIQETDARGNVTIAELGNGVTAVASYDAASGHLTDLSAYDQLGVELQRVDYLFDVLGNLKSRHDLSGSNDLEENFSYDHLNRLERVQITAPGLGISSPLETLALAYNAEGNITWKSDVGSYSYGAGSAGPHAVTRAGAKSYTYDAKGNQLTGGARNITYTTYDKAASLTLGEHNTVFTYGIGNHRVKRENSVAGELDRVTVYLGNVEYITRADGVALFKRYLGATAISTYYPASSNEQLAYLLKDHIGSIHTVLDERGLITARMHFSAFGERQDADWQTPLDSFLYAPVNDITTRGFTGHEHVDTMGVIQMNGRIYDANLGRFLQADPFVQAPGNTQSLNRYSYVFNNPLSYTDPSGFFSISKFIKKWGRTIAAVAASIFLPGLHGILALHFSVNSAFAQFVITGFIAGGITGGIKGAVKGAFLAAVTYGVTSAFNQVSEGKLVLDEANIAPTKGNLERMLGTADPTAGLYRIDVLKNGRFVHASPITSSSVTSGETIFTNGISNNFQAAVRNGTTHVAQLDGAASGYILNFNPTQSLLKDGLEATRDIASTYFGSGPSALAENLAKVVDAASRNGVTGLRLIGHSQGAAITTSALRFAADSGMSLTAVGSVNLHGAPLNDLYIRNSLAKRTGIGKGAYFTRAQFGDPVHNILGGNFISNPLRLPFSAVRVPQLFSSDATLSPHTTPCFGGRTALCSG